MMDKAKMPTTTPMTIIITGSTMEEAARRENISVKEFIISSEGKFTALAEDGWEIYFDLAGDVQWQLTKLRAVLSEKIPLEKREDLGYIELRFGNFAPFKYK